MAYLHGREYYDERDAKQKRCIMHRDLKPENCLGKNARAFHPTISSHLYQTVLNICFDFAFFFKVTEFLAIKLSDFGTSRALNGNDVAMTSVGTPLYCAPEIARGEAYNEKVTLAVSDRRPPLPRFALCLCYVGSSPIDSQIQLDFVFTGQTKEELN